MRQIVPYVAAVLLLAACRTGPRPTCVAAPPPGPRHPLDPLTEAEIRTARGVLEREGRLGDGRFVPVLVLDEPTKEAVKAFQGGPVRGRRAFAVVLDRPANRTSEAVLDVNGAGGLVSFRDVPGAQPNVLMEEFDSVPELVRADERWRAAIAKRGITDYDGVLIDTWAAGVLPVDGAEPGARLARAIAFWRGEHQNPYGRPIEGVVAVVDVTHGKVVQVIDTGVRPLTDRQQDYDAKSVGPLRPPTKPLVITQPEGPSFRLDGQEVRWEKWRFRWALHPREGLVLYAVGYEDGGRVRPILARASISEMVVPYGDPDENWVWRSAFDEGEYGLGRLANTLVPSLDVPSNAVFRDAVMADEQGAPWTLDRAVAFYERDANVLWTHYDERLDKTEARRARELVVYYTVTVGNYDYGLAWIFKQDGSLQAEAMASGVLLAKGSHATGCTACGALSEGKDPYLSPGDERTGTLVDRHIVAPAHQHFFSFRLDFDVEGEANSVAELNTRALPAGPENPHGNAFGPVPTLLATEKQAVRDMDFHDHRAWKVFNPTARNENGHLAGYMLVPGENSRPYLTPESATRKRAGFIEHHVWVTRRKPGELYAAGDYPNQRPDADGLPLWIADDEPLVGEDVVLWYTTCLTHVPRPEEWPIMAAARMGFSLLPSGFFLKNPALDVPPGR